MRLRSSVSIIVIVLGLALFAGLADATRVKVKHAPRTAHTGKPWTAVVEVERRGRRLDGFRPTMTFVGPDGREVTHPSGSGSGTYRVQVVFPHPGKWSYTVRVGDSRSYGVIRVLPQ
jgi:hypothetical protein